MVKQIKFYDPLSARTLYLRMKFSETNAVLATGTGFVYEHDNVYYLITNGHNVTGVNPETNKRISNHIGYPDQIETTCHVRYPNDRNFMVRSVPFTINLYKAESVPIWYIHPEFGYLVDVIAIPFKIESNVQENVLIHPINTYQWNEDFPLKISDEVFILGYPFAIVGKDEFPIWKRGSVATEPELDIDGLPKIFIDTATRPGMSGSPVIFQRNGFHLKGETITNDSILGQIRGFVGIYSGRIGAEDEFKAQLGIVWKKQVIEEILKGNKRGTLEFLKV